MVRTDRGRLRVIDVIPQHVEGVVHAAPEVEAVEVLGEVLPPAHIQQVAGELVEALELSSGGDKGKGETHHSSCKRQLPAQAGGKPLPTSPSQQVSIQHWGLLKPQVMGLLPSSFTHVFMPSPKARSSSPHVLLEIGDSIFSSICSYFSVPPNLEQGSIYIGAY